MEDVEVARRHPRERLERRLVDRARALAAAEHQQARILGATPEAPPGRAAIGAEHRVRDRPAGDQVALALAALDREGEADPARPARQQPVGEAEVAVGLGQDQREPEPERGQAHRAGDVAAAAHHRVGVAAAEDLARGADGARGAHRRPGGLDGLRRSRPRTLRKSIS